jgi:DNA polymerase-3 subunit epsilon
MEVESEGSETRTLEVVDLRVFKLPVIAASEQELAHHDDLLTQLDKSSGGKTVWRNSQISVA